MSERLGNLGLNAGLVLGILVVGVLAWSMGKRWLGDETAVVLAPTDDHVQVDVRNGCGESGLAARMSLYLRDQGFDVVEAGNHERTGEQASYIADRVGNTQAAERLALAVGLATERIRAEIRNDYLLDATLVIGCDYAALRPFSDDE